MYPQLNNMIAEGVKVDGSWELCIHVTDLKLDRKLRVKGDMHIGGVMLQLVESLSELFLFKKISSAPVVGMLFFCCIFEHWIILA